MTAPLEPLADIEEVAAYLGIPTSTIYNWRHLGKGPRAFKVGKHLRYRWSDINSWLDEQAEGYIPRA